MESEQNEEGLVRRLADQQSVSTDAVRTILNALRNGGGTMAQFSHSDFGGMCQWSPGMSMVGDMFNSSLKAKLDAICDTLSPYVRAQPQRAHRGSGSSTDASDRSGGASSGGASREWWPNDLGEPGAVGSQNSLRYAAFPGSRRLVIDDGGRMTVYDTGDHRISGFSQAQGGGQTATFTSQTGVIKVSDLPIVSRS